MQGSSLGGNLECRNQSFSFTCPILHFAVRISNDLAHALQLHFTIALHELQPILRIDQELSSVT